MKDRRNLKDTRFARLGLAVAVAFMLLAVVLLSLLQVPGMAVADTVPTPAYVSGSDDALNVTYWSTSGKIASAASSAYQLVRYEYQDLQWVIDGDASTPNTATIKIQWSNDNTNWSDGPQVAATGYDGDGMVQVGNLGRYTRLYATLANTSLVTITCKAVAK